MSTSRVLQHLYALGTSSTDLLRNLYCLFQNDEEEQYLSSLQGSDLTRLVDFLDQALDVTPIADDVTRRCLHKLQTICGNHTTLPSSYFIPGDVSRVGVEPVASGGFADVWEGTYGGNRVCIKCLRISQQSRQGVERAFCKEAVMWKRMRHPNVVAFIGVTRDPLQFVSEWMVNGTLSEYLDKNPDANRTCLHNILVDERGRARLTDFGFTSVVRGTNSVLVTAVQGYTARWAAPEVLKSGDKNTREADVFSFGMVVIEVFTGKCPFSEFSGPVTISKIIDGERPGRPQVPGVTDKVWGMTLGCLHQEPGVRPAMTEVVETLRECYRRYIADPNLTLFASPTENGKKHPTRSPGTDDAMNRSPTYPWSVGGDSGINGSVRALKRSSRQGYWSLGPLTDEPRAYPGSYDPTSLRSPAILDVMTDLAATSDGLKRVMDFKAGENIDMDLFNENRSLIHTGKFWRQPETGFEWNGWTELIAFLFDNYLVMTRPVEKDGVIKYQVYRWPILLDLLSLGSFTDPPTKGGEGPLYVDHERGAGDQDKTVSPNAAGGSPRVIDGTLVVYPCTVHHKGRLGGLSTLFAESAQARLEWKAKLEEAIRLRRIAQESNKVFEVKTLNMDTFFSPVSPTNAGLPWGADRNFTGKVTCSAAFVAPDGRDLVAVGCAEGCFLAMRRALHLRGVTQCAMLEDYSIFLVLADKSLFAYHIEALLPTSPAPANASQAPQKLSGGRDVQYFSVGNLDGRTLVVYMRKKNPGSLFRFLEPIIEKTSEKSKAQLPVGSRFSLRSMRSEWFRIYRDFLLPLDSHDLTFLETSIVILCSKGFELMGLSDEKSVSIPRVEDPRLEKLAKKIKWCKPMGVFRSNKDEFLLCYDDFGVYVDKIGKPSRRMGVVEWEGMAERIAWHPPYILLFDGRFIEVRHVATGRLVQVIPGMGNDFQCIWDGRGANCSQALFEGSQDEAVSQESRIHGVMNMEAPQPGMRNMSIQHVFELIPTTVSSPSSGASASPPLAPWFNPMD
ncbi:CNH domain-containing protein [Thelephora terrestris]|uniref:CNH domain-containing protein n=1 Tax=Thelephora terrestris TaxID=56493 RepID=A0A9P6H4Y2_9AGAM|nr:CNH domain-containing protein [Thelephora terrestris]